MPLGAQVGLGPSHIVLDGDPAPLKRRNPPPGWLRGPAVEHRSLAGVLSLSCVRLVADG